MGTLEERSQRPWEGVRGSTQPNWLWLLPLFFIFFRGENNFKLSIQEIEPAALEKKAKLLGRIKGYMNPDEQLIIHRAEMLLYIIQRLKILLELPDALEAQTTYHHLSHEEKVRNMLMDLSEYVETDKRELIQKAINLHMKAKVMEERVQEFQQRSTVNASGLETLENYIRVVEPILEGGSKNKAKDLKVLVGILKSIKVMQERKSLDEMTIFEMVKPFISEEQGQQMERMINLFKAISSLGEGKGEKQEAQVGEKLLEAPPETGTLPGEESHQENFS